MSSDGKTGWQGSVSGAHLVDGVCVCVCWGEAVWRKIQAYADGETTPVFESYKAGRRWRSRTPLGRAFHLPCENKYELLFHNVSSTTLSSLDLLFSPHLLAEKTCCV